FAVRVVSLGLAPSTPGPLRKPVVDVGDGRSADFDRVAQRVRGAIALVRSKPMTSLDDLFAEYLAAPETMKSAVRHGAAAILFTSTRPRDLVYRHTVTWGPVAPLPMGQIAREDGLRVARLLEGGRTVELSLDLRNRVGGAWEANNVVAEIRGSER